MTTPVDAGLQLERTTLAWRRTALALTVGLLVGSRLVAADHGELAVLAALAAGVVGPLLLLGSGRRAARARGAIAQGDRPALPGAGLLALTTAVVVGAGVAGLVLVVG